MYFALILLMSPAGIGGTPTQNYIIIKIIIIVIYHPHICRYLQSYLDTNVYYKEHTLQS